jgi:GTPase SAR1 family protein
MRRVVLISGGQGAGKTTLAQDLAAELFEQAYRPVLIKFADPLYELHDIILKKAELWGLKGIQRPDGLLLQVLGTDWGRERLGPHVWVEMAHKRIKESLKDARAIVIIDDLRFPNEAGVWDRNDCCLVRLEASAVARKARAKKWRDNTSHPSEVALDYDRKRFDMQFTTEGTYVPRQLSSEVWAWLKNKK